MRLLLGGPAGKYREYRVLLNEKYGYIGVLVHFGANDFRQCTVTPEVVPPNVKPSNMEPRTLSLQISVKICTYVIEVIEGKCDVVFWTGRETFVSWVVNTFLLKSSPLS